MQTFSLVYRKLKKELKCKIFDLSEQFNLIFTNYSKFNILFTHFRGDITDFGDRSSRTTSLIRVLRATRSTENRNNNGETRVPATQTQPQEQSQK